MKKKTLLLTTLAGSMLIAGMAMPTTKAVTDTTAIVNEDKEIVAVELANSETQLSKEQLKTLIAKAYEGKNLKPEITVEGDVKTGSTVKVGENKTLTVVVYGDVNGDGAVNSKDAVAIAKHSTGAETLEGAALIAAGLDNNTDNINSKDAVKVAKFSTGALEESLVKSGVKIEEKINPEQEVQEHKCTYTQGVYDNIAKSHTWKCTECGESGVEPCTFSEWTSTDGKTAKRTCLLCGGVDTATTLSAALSDGSTKELTVDTIDTSENELTIPRGTTVTVNEEITTASNDVTVNGTLVLKTKQENLKLKGTGTVIYAPEVETPEEFAEQFPNAEGILGGIQAADKEAAKGLKYEIIVPSLSEVQTITEDTQIELEAGWNLTVDLGNNILTSKNTNNNLIKNSGNLTIKNGTLTTAEKNNNPVINDQGSRLTLENVDVKGNKGIRTNGNLGVIGGKIVSKSYDNNSYALAVLTDAETRSTAVLNNVDIVARNIGAYIGGANHSLIMYGGTITTKGSENKDYALASYATDAILSLEGTKIQSDDFGVYLQNGAESGKPGDVGNLAELNNVELTSEKASIWVAGQKDRVEVTGGTITSNEEVVLRISSKDCGHSILKDCTLSGHPTVTFNSNITEEQKNQLVTLTDVTENKK